MYQWVCTIQKIRNYVKGGMAGKIVAGKTTGRMFGKIFK
jgi:hypothetical protein